MCLVVPILNNTRTEVHPATESASGGRRPLLILGWASLPREHIAQTRREKTKIGAFLFFLGEKSGGRHGGGGCGKEVWSSLEIHAYQELSNVNISRNLSFGVVIS